VDAKVEATLPFLADNIFTDYEPEPKMQKRYTTEEMKAQR